MFLARKKYRVFFPNGPNRQTLSLHGMNFAETFSLFLKHVSSAEKISRFFPNGPNRQTLSLHGMNFAETFSLFLKHGFSAVHSKFFSFYQFQILTYVEVEARAKKNPIFWSKTSNTETKRNSHHLRYH